jgi:hypothetical protein
MFSACKSRTPNLPEVACISQVVGIAACRLSGWQYFRVMRSVYALRTKNAIIIIIIIK